MNPWVIAFPSLLYLASIGVGMTLFVYQVLGLGTFRGPFALTLLVPYLAISVSLNMLLTLMIVVRLVLYSMNIRASTGSSGVGGLYKTVITMFIESSALYAVNSLLVVVRSSYAVVDIFLPILAENQVIASLLIVQRVANRSALTSRTIVTGHESSVIFRSRGQLTDGDGAPPRAYAVNLVDRYGLKNSGEPGVGIEVTIDSRRDVV